MAEQITVSVANYLEDLTEEAHKIGLEFGRDFGKLRDHYTRKAERIHFLADLFDNFKTPDLAPDVEVQDITYTPTDTTSANRSIRKNAIALGLMSVASVLSAYKQKRSGNNDDITVAIKELSRLSKKLLDITF